MSKHIRIVVKLCKQNEVRRSAAFTECILQYFDFCGVNQGRGKVHVCLRNNALEISDHEFPDSEEVTIKHPSFCPVLHLSPSAAKELSPDILLRGIDVGAAILLESFDGHILLTRRAKHLRIFPGLWVPPGGHVEENESLMQAGLRELQEETGLKLTSQDFKGGKIELLALWESVFPPKLSVGPPKRHHTVVYFHAQLVEGMTSAHLEKRLNFDPGEVDACAWFDRDFVTAIVNADDESKDSSSLGAKLPARFRALVLDANNKQCISELPTQPLFRVHSDDESDSERVSTGTKFALHQHMSRLSSLL